MGTTTTNQPKNHTRTAASFSSAGRTAASSHTASDVPPDEESPAASGRQGSGRGAGRPDAGRDADAVQRRAGHPDPREPGGEVGLDGCDPVEVARCVLGEAVAPAGDPDLQRVGAEA